MSLMYRSLLHYFKTVRFNCFLITFCFCKIMWNTENKYTGCKVSASRSQENKLGQCLILNLLNSKEFQDTKRTLFQGFHSLVGKKIHNRAVSYDRSYLTVVNSPGFGVIQTWTLIQARSLTRSAVSQSVCFLNCRMGTLTPKVIGMKIK